MKYGVRSRALASAGWAAILLAVAVTAVATEEDTKWWTPPELSLTTIVPFANQTALEFESGWALTLHMTALESRMIGIGKESYPPTLPGMGDRGWLVFDDADGCPSFIESGFQGGVYKSYWCDGGSSDYPECVPPNWGPLLPYACPDLAPAGYDWWADLTAMEPWPFNERLFER